MSYATPSDLLARYDARTVGDLCKDDGNRVAVTDLQGNANLQAALDDASGEIESALLQGERYAVADLAALQGASKSYLIRICCDVAMGFLWERRPWNSQAKEIDGPARGRQSLERLRKGENVLNIASALDAGVPNNVGPTTVDLQNLNLITRQTRNYFPLQFLPNNR